MKKDDVLFVMQQPDTFTWPVKVRVPLNGTYGEAKFNATFPNMDDDELKELLASNESGGPRLTDREVAERVLLGFEPIEMPDGSRVEFSKESKARLLKMPRAATAVVGTFIAVSRGVAAEKN